MDIKNIIKSTSYLEFINEIDALFWETLYSKARGFINLKSKEAINEAQKTLDKFKHEAAKIRHNVDFEDADNIIELKKQELIDKMNEHCYKQTMCWVEEVSKTVLDNSILAVSIDKNNAKNLYNRGLCAIEWMSGIKEEPLDKKNEVIKKFEQEFKNALNAKDEDYIPLSAPQKSDMKTFFKLFNLIFDDEKFLQEDISSYQLKLNSEDLAFFTNISRNLQIYKKTVLKDEIALIKSALEILEIKDDEQKYKFIKDIENDFYFFEQKNQKIEEEDKINLVKRRIKLFSKDIQKTLDYYRKKLTALTEKSDSNGD